MKLSSLLQKVVLAVAGIAALEIVGNLYDYLVYPAVTYYFGRKIWLSFLVLFGTALVLNYLLVVAYDCFKKDLFGFERIKKIKEDVHDKTVTKTKLEKRILHLERYGSIPLFLFLSWYDPFLAVLYKRRSSEFKGFTRKDYGILIFSTFFACVIWSGVWSWVGFLRK